MAGGIVSAVPRRVNGSFAYRRDINPDAWRADRFHYIHGAWRQSAAMPWNAHHDSNGLLCKLRRGVESRTAHHESVPETCVPGHRCTLPPGTQLQSHVQNAKCYHLTKQASRQNEPATRSFVFSIFKRPKGYFAAFNRSATAFQLTTLKNAAT